MAVSPFVKQLFVALSPLLAGFAVGGAVSFPTVLLHQLKRNDTTIQIDFETSSWIGSIQGLAGLPSVLMPAFMQWQGRKLAFIAAGLISITGWIVAFAADSAALVLTSECFHGLGSNSVYAVTCLTITEMIAPQYRDAFIQIYYLANFTAMAVSGLLVQFVHWKTISIIMCVPMILAVVAACAWPESPYWLAYKRKFGKCEEAFIWLRGSDPVSTKELNELIDSNKMDRKREIHSSTRRTDENNIKSLWKQVSNRDFYVPCLHMTVLEFLIHGTGGIIITVYSIELFMKTTTNETVVFFAGFIVNVVILLGFITHLSITKYFKKKTLLLSSTLCGIVSILSAAVVTYLQDIGVLSDDSIGCLICLIVYIMSISTGLMPLAYPIASSLMPVRHRGVGGIIYVTYTCLFHTLALKSAPYMFVYIHMWGTFIVFAGVGVFCGLIIWRFVPETKDRTLQEIDNYYTFGNFENNTKDENLEAMIVNS